MPGCSFEKWRNCVRLLRASYNRLASVAMVSLDNMRNCFLSFSEACVQIIVLQRAGLAELVEFQRERQPTLRIRLREMRLHDVEQTGGSRLLGSLATADADLQDGVNERRVGERAVGDAILIARDGAYSHTPGREHRQFVDFE